MPLSITEQRDLQNLAHRVLTVETYVSHLFGQGSLEKPAAPPAPAPVGLESLPVAGLALPIAAIETIAGMSAEQKALVSSLLAQILGSAAPTVAASPVVPASPVVTPAPASNAPVDGPTE